jgi:exopolyphosphatase/guanosine-5'-triphosphate,3'-diphosphate pyrophosphatase
LKIAVIDIGTNSIHMLMADILPSFYFEVIGREKEMTRLGDGTLTNGYLSQEVMDRGLITVKKFYHLAQTKGIRKIIAVATSAVREAHNGGDFIRAIYKEIKLKVRVITGEEEGRLIYLGVKNSVELKRENTLIIDIGGGSAEIMVVTPKRIHYLVSLKMGVARLKELFLKTESPKALEKLEKFVSALLQPVAPAVAKLGFRQVIGTSGTLNNLAAMASFLLSGNSEASQKSNRLDFEDLKKLYRFLRGATSEERARLRGLDPKRTDLILGGAAVTYVLMKTLGIENIAICDKAIREGMIYDYIERNRTKITREATVPNVRRRNVLRLAAKCKSEPSHAEQVARLTLQLFDKTQVIHNLGPTDRELLEYAALLHDIGYHISYEQHHLHAYYLIKNVTMNGFSEEEIDILALSARYHRGPVPKKSHDAFVHQPKSVKRKVQWLSALLRLADALDRTRFSVVANISLRIKKKSLQFILHARNDAEYEIWEARRKCDLLEKLSGRKVAFSLRPVGKLKKINFLRA